MTTATNSTAVAEDSATVVIEEITKTVAFTVETIAVEAAVTSVSHIVDRDSIEAVSNRSP